MRLRYWAAGLAAAGGVSAAASALVHGITAEPAPASLTAAADWGPEQPAPPARAVASTVLPPAQAAARPSPARAAPALPPLSPPYVTWTHEIAPGETLDTLLADAGLAGGHRAEVSVALGEEYDLRRLRPGHRLTVETMPDGRPHRVVLGVDDGVRIEARFGRRLATRVHVPDPKVTSRAGETRIESSIFASLDGAGLPARFAVDLARILGGVVDLSRDLSGGETLRVLWNEARFENRLVGRPEITFAALDLGDALYEIIWPGEGSGRALIYRDGEVVRVFAQPVDGARLSSVFGPRKHPIHGDMRMHTGVDFAAAQGTPVRATAPGRIRFIGRRSGYGRMVEIAHGPEMTTRYAHLSTVPGDLGEGQRVAAGDTIGRVGATGTATGPHLHYEVRVNDRPIDPLSDRRLARIADAEVPENGARRRLEAARDRLAKAITTARSKAGQKEG